MTRAAKMRKAMIQQLQAKGSLAGDGRQVLLAQLSPQEKETHQRISNIARAAIVSDQERHLAPVCMLAVLP